MDATDNHYFIKTGELASPAYLEFDKFNKYLNLYSYKKSNRYILNGDNMYIKRQTKLL